MPIGDQTLAQPEWESFAQALAEKKSRREAYIHAYGERKDMTQKACFLLKNERIVDRVLFLSGGKIKIKVNRFSRKPKVDSDKEFDLQSVVKTCREVIDGFKSSPLQRLRAVEVLNKLGVFDNENKNDIKRMDPSAVCEYLAQFAAAPSKELERMPGGLSGMMKRLMDLTGSNKDVLKAALDEVKEDAVLEKVMTDHPGPDGKPVNERLEPALEAAKNMEENIDF